MCPGQTCAERTCSGWGRHKRQDNKETTVLVRSAEGLARTVTKGTEGRGTAKKFLREHQQGGEKDATGVGEMMVTSMLLPRDFPVLCLHGFILKDK